MCGILGYISFVNQQLPIEKLQNSLDLLNHRGPDHSGSWESSTAWLGHRRLAIIDLSENANQPMISDCKRYVIVMNGEIYNYQDYIPFLEKKGYTLLSTGDTEVFLGLYTFLGPKALEYINGMFALAIWDIREQKLFLARDRLGKKPLYYHFDGSHIIFASELKALVLLLKRRTLDGEAIDAYFSLGYVPSPLSIYKEVRKLEAATYLEVKTGSIRKERYWVLNPGEKSAPSDEEIEEVLLRSIDLRFVSDVPVGVFLSGGIDSSLITALAAGKLGHNFRTFCVAGGEDMFDERSFASIVAKQYGTEHLSEHIEQIDLRAQIERVIPFIDEPFSDSSILPTYLVCNLASKYGKVVLSGEGGDEVFGGYDKYARWQKVRLFRKVPWFLRRFLGTFESWISGYGTNYWQSLVKLSRHSLSESLDVFTAFNSLMPPVLKRRLFLNEFERKYCIENRAYFQRVHDGQFDYYTLEEIMDVDRRTYLAEDLMFKADRMSMANSLELRCPFLDYRLVELSVNIPEKDKMVMTRSKILLRRLASEYLPDKITKRAKKGFSIPISEWFREQLIPVFQEHVRQDEVLCNIFDYKEIERRFFMHRSGIQEFGNQLWAILMFHLWWRFHGCGADIPNIMD